MADNLAAKYRPTKLEDLTEQTLVADIVRKMCESKNITNRNFLFIGPAGTGKTTTAKIIGNMLNGSSENCIEIDAASYNGVDAMRDIMNQARSYPVGTDYKIFIVDECFPGDSLIRTTSGLVPIKDIRPGDRIYNLTGQATVSHVFQNSVKTENLTYVRLNSKGIITTRDHLFFTDEGWVAAQDLKEGDILYDYATMQNIQSRSEIQKGCCISVSDSFEEETKSGIDIKVSCKEISTEEGANISSYELQTRPRLIRTDDKSRGGWDRPQYEIATVARRKEGQATGVVRVDSVTVYQRGHNDELFQSSFPDTKICDAEYVTMYDVEVEGHPSYYVSDVLVHNCHALSANAWQVALKTIEEQPAKSIFIWATTNPEKIPATILSRVQTFQLSKISLDGIYNRLVYIIDQEVAEGRNITYEPEAVRYIAKLANGGMRDAITLLDKSLSYSEAVTQENIQAALGLPSYDDYFSLLNAVAKKDNAKITEIINNVYNSGVNFCKWFEGFFSFVTNIVKYIYLQDINQTMIPSTYQDKISGYSTAHAALCLKLSNKLVKMNQELKSTQYLQELAISYLCTPPERKKA